MLESTGEILDKCMPFRTDMGTLSVEKWRPINVELNVAVPRSDVMPTTSARTTETWPSSHLTAILAQNTLCS